MKKNSHLYNALLEWMGQPCAWAHLGDLKTCLWIIAALIETGSVNLTRWLPYIPCRGEFAQKRNPKIKASPYNNTRLHGFHRYAPGGWP